MSGVPPGWYKDPADPATQRYWDGEGWFGDPIPADATPPAGPPPRPEPMLRTEPPVTQPTEAPPRPTPAPATATTLPGFPPGFPQYLPGVLPRPHGLPLASPGRRLAARMVDFVVVLALVVVADAWLAYRWWQVMTPALSELWDRMQRGDSSTANLPTPPAQASALVLMIVTVMTAVWFAYEVPSTANSGQTLGKRLLGLKVMRLESEERLGMRRSFRRWGRLGLPTLLWYCYGFGLVLQFVDCLFVAIDRPLRQALHDRSAFTVVVRVRRAATTTSQQAKETSRGESHVDPR